MRPCEENDQLGGVMHLTAACKMQRRFFLFLLVSRAILERSRVTSVLSGERDGAEQCGEVLSPGDLSRSRSAHMLWLSQV